MRNPEHSNLVDRLGGTSEVARLCQVSSQAVSKWRNDGIPPARLMYLRLARPDIFGPVPQPGENPGLATKVTEERVHD